jgi:hypothetical protein
MTKLEVVEKKFHWIENLLKADDIAVEVTDVHEDGATIHTPVLGKVVVEAYFYPQENIGLNDLFLHGFVVKEMMGKETEIKLTDKYHFVKWFITHEKLFRSSKAAV